MAVCNGAYVSKLIDVDDRAPFYSFIGAWGEVKVWQIERFTRFFDELFSSKNLKSAIEYLNCDENGNRPLELDSEIKYYRSDNLFEKIWDVYEDQYYNRKARVKKVNEVLAERLSKGLNKNVSNDVHRETIYNRIIQEESTEREKSRILFLYQDYNWP